MFGGRFNDPWPADRSLLKTIAGFSIPVLLFGSVGYRYLTTATPVTRDEAVRLFRAEAAAPEAVPSPSPSGDFDARRPAGGKQRVERVGRPEHRDRRSSPSPDQEVQLASTGGSGETAAAPRRADRSEERAQPWQPGAPEEGVYSWTTEGYESFNGSRRAFPRETQRIITQTGRTSWTLHHYFSKERESWSDVSTSKDGYSISSQRNKVVFGPVTRDVTISFSPPMVTGPIPPRVGAKWQGRWDGNTYGTYDSRYFERTSLAIDGERVEVWGIELQMQLHGETEGTVWAQVWVSPETHMVVKEHYRQDVQSGPGTYRSEWLMTIRSLEPQR